MYQFETPFRSFHCGPSMSDQTRLLTKIIQNGNKMVYRKSKKYLFLRVCGKSPVIK